MKYTQVIALFLADTTNGQDESVNDSMNSYYSQMYPDYNNNAAADPGSGQMQQSQPQTTPNYFDNPNIYVAQPASDQIQYNQPLPYIQPYPVTNYNQAGQGTQFAMPAYGQNNSMGGQDFYSQPQSQTQPYPVPNYNPASAMSGQQQQIQQFPNTNIYPTNPYTDQYFQSNMQVQQPYPGEIYQPNPGQPYQDPNLNQAPLSNGQGYPSQPYPDPNLNPVDLMNNQQNFPYPYPEPNSTKPPPLLYELERTDPKIPVQDDGVDAPWFRPTAGPGWVDPKTIIQRDTPDDCAVGEIKGPDGYCMGCPGAVIRDDQGNIAGCYPTEFEIPEASGLETIASTPPFPLPLSESQQQQQFVPPPTQDQWQQQAPFPPPNQDQWQQQTPYPPPVQDQWQQPSSQESWQQPPMQNQWQVPLAWQQPMDLNQWPQSPVQDQWQTPLDPWDQAPQLNQWTQSQIQDQWQPPVPIAHGQYQLPTSHNYWQQPPTTDFWQQPSSQNQAQQQTTGYQQYQSPFYTTGPEQQQAPYSFPPPMTSPGQPIGQTKTNPDEIITMPVKIISQPGQQLDQAETESSHYFVYMDDIIDKGWETVREAKGYFSNDAQGNVAFIPYSEQQLALLLLKEDEYKEHQASLLLEGEQEHKASLLLEEEQEQP